MKAPAAATPPTGSVDPLPAAGRLLNRPVSAAAALVLSLATGMPLASARNLVPHSGDQEGPYLGF